MPNHIQNKLQIIAPKKVLNFILSSISNKGNVICFTKIIPPPSNDPAYNDLPSQEKAKNSPNWWYEWNSTNWGTKWNAYNLDDGRTDLSKGLIYFQTAWSCPFPVIQKLIESNPSAEFRIEYADEDIGSNVGIIIGKLGAIEYTELYGEDAIKLACELHQLDINDYGEAQ